MKFRDCPACVEYIETTGRTEEFRFVMALCGQAFRLSATDAMVKYMSQHHEFGHPDAAQQKAIVDQIDARRTAPWN